MGVLGLTRGVFESHCPAGVEATGEVWSKVEGQLPHCLSVLTGRLAVSVDDLTGVCVAALAPAQRYVCVSTFLNCLASHDVVLTASGFGVVNTQHVLPASALRVQALREELRCMAGDAYDDVVEALQGCSDWSAVGFRAELVPTARMARSLGLLLRDGRSPYGVDIDMLRGGLLSAQWRVCSEFGLPLVEAVLHGVWHDAWEGVSVCVSESERRRDGLLVYDALSRAVGDLMREGGVGEDWRAVCWGRLSVCLPRVPLLHSSAYYLRMTATPDLDGRPEGNAFFFGI